MNCLIVGWRLKYATTLNNCNRLLILTVTRFPQMTDVSNIYSRQNIWVVFVIHLSIVSNAQWSNGVIITDVNQDVCKYYLLNSFTSEK